MKYCYYAELDLYPLAMTNEEATFFLWNNGMFLLYPSSLIHSFIHSPAILHVHSERQCSLLRYGFRSQMTRVQVLSLPLVSQVTLGGIFHLCVPHSSHLWNRDDNTPDISDNTPIVGITWDYSGRAHWALEIWAILCRFQEPHKALEYRHEKDGACQQELPKSGWGWRGRHIQLLLSFKQRGNGTIRVESGKTPWRKCCLKLCLGTTAGGKENAKLQEQHVD